MSTVLTYEQVVELLPAYTLGALEPEEMLAVDDYLEQQRALLARVERLDLATSQLAYGAPSAPLSPQLKLNLMAQVRPEATVLPPSTSVTQAMPSPRTSASVADTPRNPLLASRAQPPLPTVGRRPAIRPSLPVRPAPRRYHFGWAAAAVMAVAALFIIWIDIGTQRQVGQLQAELANRDGAINQLYQQIQTMEEQLQQDQAQLAFFSNPAQVVPLTGTDNAPNAGGVFYQSDERALVVLHGLPPLPAEQTYQLWLIPAEGAPAPAGLLSIQSAAINRLQVTLPANALAYSMIGISIEPASGSPAPTGDIVITGVKT
ncbi:MAG: anti-sigma factor [Caldilineaceae bacterium]|nr:anti-sigma factor [Caldilineaceae bacterium]